jgi:hypothetical protein
VRRSSVSMTAFQPSLSWAFLHQVRDKSREARSCLAPKARVNFCPHLSESCCMQLKPSCSTLRLGQKGRAPHGNTRQAQHGERFNWVA